MTNKLAVKISKVSYSLFASYKLCTVTKPTNTRTDVYTHV